MWLAAEYRISSIARGGRAKPFANLQSLGLDQVVSVSSSSSQLWFVGSRNDVRQAIVGTVSLAGVVTSEPLGNAPCSNGFVYFSNLVQGPDRAMYGGFGCGDQTGTHAGYLVRVSGS